MLLLCYLAPLAAQVPGLNYQVYTDPGGNRIHAHIWKVVGNDVFLETDRGSKLRLPLNVFSAASQSKLRTFVAPPPTAFTPAPPTPTAPPPPTTAPLTTTAFGTPPAGTTNAPPPPITTTGLPPTTSAFPTPGASTALPTGAPAPAIAASNPFSGTPAPAGAGSPVDITAILQGNAAIIGHADFAKIAQSPFFQSAKAMMPASTPDAQPGSGQLFGLGVEDISAVALCVPSLEGIDASSFEGGADNLPPGFKYSFAVAFSKPIGIEEAKQMLQADPQHPPTFSEFAGATLATAAPGTPDMPPNFCMALKNQGTGGILLGGDQASVQAALTNGQARTATSNSTIFSNLPAERDFWLTVEIPPALTQQIMQEASAGGSKDPQSAMIAGLVQQFKTIGLALTFTDSAKLNLFAQCQDAQGATQVSNAINGLVTMAKMAQQDPAAGAKVPAFLNTLTIAAQDAIVSATVQITMADLAQLPLLMGAAGPGSDGPPPGFGSGTSTAPPGFSAPGGAPPGFAPTNTPMPIPGGPAAGASSGGNPFPTPGTPPAPSGGAAVNPFAN